MMTEANQPSDLIFDLFKGVAILALASTFIGCQSMNSKAKEAYDKGEFLAAAGLYEEMLSSDKNDAEAKEGLQKARQQLLQGRLIKVRMARLGKNYEGAFELLKTVIQDETRWGISPQHQAYATQQEELNEILKWMAIKIKNDLDSGHPLKAHLELNQRKRMLLLSNEEKDLVNLNASVIKEGQRHCRTLRKQSSGHFSNAFSHKYCNYWGIQEKSNSASSERSLKFPKISAIKLNSKMKGLPQEFQDEVSNSILKGLQQTPYYGPNGLVLPVTIQGTYTSFYEERPTIQTHFYEVQVPFQVFETETYTENIPFTDYRTTLDPKLGRHIQEPFTNYRREARTKQVAVTKHRTETRSLTFGATEFHLRYELLGSLSFNLENQSFTIPLNEQLSLNDIYHNVSNKEIGLAPKGKSAPEAAQWIKEKLAVVPVKAEDMVRTHWTTKYCTANASQSTQAATEEILLCAVGAKELPTAVKQWATAQFGLPYGELAGAIGL